MHRMLLEVALYDTHVLLFLQASGNKFKHLENVYEKKRNCSRKLWVYHPWSCSRLSCMGPRELDLHDLCGPFKHNLIYDSMISCFSVG